MKILITYASAGAGHRVAAEAIYESLKKNGSLSTPVLVDILDYAPSVFKQLYSDGYIFAIRRLPSLWYLLYITAFIFPRNPLIKFFEDLNSRAFISFARKQSPDLVIGTHFLSGNIVRKLKARKMPDLKFISVVTDYILHPLWINEAVDLYVVSCENVQYQLLKRGVDGKKIKVMGIPVKEKFYTFLNRGRLAEKLGVSAGDFTVLIVTGTIGIGPIEKIVREFDDAIQMLVICGNNERLYQRLNSLGFKKLRLYHLVDNMEELMSVSDVVLTKAGGLTVTECLIKGLPMVLFANIPGLETSNARILRDYAAAIRAETPSAVKKAIFSLKDNPLIYQVMVNNIHKLKKTDTLKNIMSEVESLLGKRGV